MTSLLKRIVVLLFGLAVLQPLAGCVVYDRDHGRHGGWQKDWHGGGYDRHDGRHHRHGGRRW